jgi:hypothetical protein
MAGVPYVFGNATTSIPLTNLDANFNTGLTIGNTTIGLGNTTTTLGNVTLTNATIVANTSVIAANAVIYSTSTGNLTGNATIFSVNSGNVGIGTASPSAKFQVSGSGATGAIKSTGYLTDYNTSLYTVDGALSNYSSANAVYLNGNRAGWLDLQADGTQNTYIQLFGSAYSTPNLIGFYTGSAERMRIDSAGNLGLGVTPSTSSQVTFEIGAVGNVITTNGTNDIQFTAGGYYNGGWKYAVTSSPVSSYYQDSGIHVWRYSASGTAGNAITWSEAMRIDASGSVVIGTTDTSLSSGAGIKFNPQASQPNMGIVINNAGAGSNYHYYNTNATNNGFRFYVRNDGGIANFSANNSNLSDERTKKNINNAGNYLDKICAIPVRTFLYKDQDDTQLNLGVIAQEVEAIAPELVDVSGFGETPEDGIPLKAIYQTDLQYALMKSIQELKATVDAQAARIAVLEGAK